MRWEQGVAWPELLAVPAAPSPPVQQVSHKCIRVFGIRLTVGFDNTGRSGGGGWFGGAGGGGGFKGSSSFAGGVKSESKPGFAQADGSRYRETRINADKLNVIAPEEEYDSEDEAMMAALSSRTASVLPMGIYRREHKDTGVVVATTAELEAAENATGEEESLWVDGDDAAPPTVVDQPEDGVWDTDTKQPVVIKKEPGSDEMDLDTKDTSKTPEAETTETERKPATEGKPKKVLPQEPEEKMIQSDLDLLAHELGNVTITENGETRTEEPANKDGRMYLFQFPPLLPPLKQVAAAAPASSKVKAEPEDAGMVDLTAPAPDPTAVDLTQEANDEDSGDEDEEEDPEDKAGFMSQLMSQGGMVGKLNVRKSGKVELDWGGRILEMSPAAGMNFLSSAVIVEESDEKPKAGVVGGESIGMGKIMGRFVLAPTWDEEEDWEVSPEELRID